MQTEAIADGAAVGIVAGPYQGRRGWVSWSDDIVVCVRLEPSGLDHEGQALTFLPSYVRELGR